MISTLYVVGVGPGDPELLTLKAVRVLKDIPLLFVPKGREDKESLALRIVESAVDLSGKEIRELYFPMVKTKEPDDRHKSLWQTFAEEIIRIMSKGNAAFVTLGDPSFYSTFFYLYDRLLALRPDLKIEFIPGVSSINAASAKAGLSLGLADKKIAIIPANYFNFKKDYLFDNKDTFAFDTIVFMKVNKDFEKIKGFLSERDLLKKAVYVSRVGLDREKVIYDLNSVTPADLDYFSILIVKSK